MTDADYVDLRNLPEEHPMRNALLVDIGAEYKKTMWLEWRPILRGSGKFEDRTYNQLDGPWLADYYQWRAPKEKA